MLTSNQMANLADQLAKTFHDWAVELRQSGHMSTSTSSTAPVTVKAQPTATGALIPMVDVRDTRERRRRRTWVLREVVRAGGRVLKLKLYSIGEQVAWDHRGMGGLYGFARDHRATASIIEDSDNSAYVLITDYGRRFVAENEHLLDD
jgi:hypothetical protein